MLLNLVTHSVNMGYLLILSEKGGNHTRGQHVIDELQEGLVLNMGIGEQEHRIGTIVLGSQYVVEVLQLLTEIQLSVVTFECDFKALVAGCPAC